MASKKIVTQAEYEGRAKPKKAQVNNKKVGKKTGKKVSITQRIFQLLDAKGDAATYDEGLKIAKDVKKDTKFNKFHWAWYKGAFKKQQ